jgi:hypothetical protein
LKLTAPALSHLAAAGVAGAEKENADLGGVHFLLLVGDMADAGEAHP